MGEIGIFSPQTPFSPEKGVLISIVEAVRMTQVISIQGVAAILVIAKMAILSPARRNRREKFQVVGGQAVTTGRWPKLAAWRGEKIGQQARDRSDEAGMPIVACSKL